MSVNSNTVRKRSGEIETNQVHSKDVLMTQLI